MSSTRVDKKIVTFAETNGATQFTIPVTSWKEASNGWRHDAQLAFCCCSNWMNAWQAIEAPVY